MDFQFLASEKCLPNSGGWYSENTLVTATSSIKSLFFFYIHWVNFNFFLNEMFLFRSLKENLLKLLKTKEIFNRCSHCVNNETQQSENVNNT